MAQIFLSANESTNIGNNNDVVFSSTGTEVITIGTGITGITVNQATEGVRLNGAFSSFTFQQQGINLVVYQGGVVVVTIPLQNDADGTRITTTDGTVSAFVSSSGMTLGSTTVTAGTTSSQSTTVAPAPASIDTTNKTPGGTTGTGPGTGAVGQTFTLTTGVDNLNGTTGNDTFIGDNTGGGANQISVADTINGHGGTDTFKAYLPSTVTTVSSGSLPTLNGVANLYVNGATLSTANLTGFTGLTGFTIDNNIETVTATNTITTSGQAVTLANYSPNVVGGAAVAAQVFTTAITSTTDVTANVTLSNIRNGSHLNAGVATTDTQTLDIAGIRMATLNLTSTGAGT